MTYQELRPVIQVKNLEKWYGPRQVLYSVNFAVRKGECFCLLGPNGAGKTTIMKIITGMLRTDYGSVEIMGMCAGEFYKKHKKAIAIVPQYTNLDPLLTVEENLIFFGLLQKMKYSELEERIAYLLEQFEITRLRKEVTYHCSGGEHQRLLVARAFLLPCTILFMDEPTAGIDILFKNQLWDFFKKEKERGMTIFLNTHDLTEAEVLSDRIGFLLEGNLIAVDSPEKLKSIVHDINITIECENIIQHREMLSESKHEQLNDRTVVLKVKSVDHHTIRLLEKLTTYNHIIDIKVSQPSLNDVFKQLGGTRAGNTMA